VCDQETSKNEEAKARYWAVKIQPQWVVTPGKQTNIYVVFSRRSVVKSLLKATASFCMPVCLSTLKTLIASGLIFAKTCTGAFD
jgi:hypothetical protein